MVEAYELYATCRTVQVFHLEVVEGQRAKHIIVNLPVGFGSLPEAGGLLDQPVWTMEMFNHFKAGELAAANRQLGG